jgi:hypothetical protein
MVNSGPFGQAMQSIELDCVRACVRAVFHVARRPES